MKTAYCAIGFKSRQFFDAEINIIRDRCRENNINLFVFADAHHFSPSEEKEMMEKAFLAIRQADLLIAEVSEKAIGVGIEIGYAKALDKQVIFLRKKQAPHSTTASGSADYHIVYENGADLTQKLSHLLGMLKIN
jgi:nucleoside 2-deoxyribosyltransferase